MSLMGIDIGTTGCKAGAFSVNGACLGMAYREYTNTQTAASRAELDSEEVFSKVKAVVAEVAGAAQDNPVNALCVSTMGEAMVPVSQDRRILGNSILSSDLRGGEYAQQLEAEFGQRAFYEINPNIIGCNYAIPKLDRDLMQLYYQITEPAYFRELGFSFDYRDPESGALNRRAIKRAIDFIVEDNKDSYPHLNPATNSLDFQSLPAFIKSFLLMIQRMEVTKME